MAEFPALQIQYAISKIQWSKATLRAECILAFKQQCQYCQKDGDLTKGPDGQPWHLDRRVPPRLGGSYEAGNVVLACCRCNCQKSDRDPGDKPEWDAALTLDAVMFMTGRFTFRELTRPC